MIEAIKSWWTAKVRMVKWGKAPHYPYYIRLTPNPGFSFAWFGGRIRWAPHHGLQKVTWNGRRWVVQRQILGTSTVRGFKPRSEDS